MGAGSGGGSWLNWNEARRPPRGPCPGTLTPRQAVLGRSRGGAEQDGHRHGAGRRPEVGAGTPAPLCGLTNPAFLGRIWVIPSIKEGRCLW